MIPFPAVPKSMFLAPFAAVFLVVISHAATSVGGGPHYANHTVGGDLGWHFNRTTNTSVANYTSWSSISFYLGDFLLFNKDPDSTVIQTYNATTYRLCSIDQDYGNLTSQFGVEDAEDEHAAVPVELTKQGDNYFFSSTENGLQCRNGMQFSINVMHGNGLPVPSPPPPPPSPLLSLPTHVHGSDGGVAATRWNLGFALLLVWAHLV